ncbi:MAG: hypothetical protein GXP40_12200 [Chloroflexi bacterium]|nr:hypothetical protein [Chloroflexota bacterium]
MHKKSPLFLSLAILITALACSLPFMAAQPTSIPQLPPVSPAEPTATVFSGTSNLPTLVVPTSTPVIVHTMTPSASPSNGAIVYDVFSKDTAPEKRAPYGDSYKINRLERPFLQDMTYVSDMDIVTYNLSQDADWYYVSIKLIGPDPNNSLGINFGVELDNDIDGFGDVIIWAQPPYTEAWTNNNVQVFADKNHDTGGLSAERSDAPIDTDGYETLVFDRGLGDDPDLAWVRFIAGTQATVQFAFKKSLANSAFMLGVLSDAGLKDVTKLDYNDRFTEEEAGSPVRSNRYYPLKALYAVDNACRSAFGFKPTGFEPQLCPSPESPTKQAGCTNPSQYTDAGSCTAAGCLWTQNPNVIAAVVYYCTYP